MLAMSVRVRPCSERDWRSSLGRLTSTDPSSERANRDRHSDNVLQLPLGPLDRDGLSVDGHVDT
jgi:hypothetical protein